MTFIDIGEIKCLKCVERIKDKTRDWVMVDAIGSKGNFRFCLFPVAYSRKTVSGALKDIGNVELFDIRLLAFLCLDTMFGLSGNHLYQRLKVGDEIYLPDSDKAWDIMKAQPFGYVGLLQALRDWVNSEGEEVPEPESFKSDYALFEMYQKQELLHQGSINGDKSKYELFLETLKSIASPIAIGDHDFMMDWYEVTATAARTINLHILQWKDFKPNMVKIEAFNGFCAKNIARMEMLRGRSEYAKHLWKRKDQIVVSGANGWREKIDKVELYRYSSFGTM